MNRGGFEWGLDETEVGPHTFSCARSTSRATSASRRPTPGACSASHTIFLPGPHPESTGFTPPETPLDPATGGETLSTTAIIDFEANVADATFECSLDLEPFVPCTPPVTYESLLARRPHAARHRAPTPTASSRSRPSEYEWEIVDAQRHHAAGDLTIERAPAPELELDDLRVHRHRRPDAAASCSRSSAASTAPTSSTGRSARARSTCSTSTPTRTRRWRRASTRSRCARSTWPSRVREPEQPNPNFEGNVDPTPADLHVDDDGGHDAAQHRRSLTGRRRDRLENPPIRDPGHPGVRVRVPGRRLHGTDNATPDARARRSSASSTSTRGSRASRPSPCEGLEAGPAHLRIRRSTSR